MGRIIVSAVDQGAETCDHLNHGGVETLSKRIGGKVRHADVILMVDHTRRPGFARQINICL